MARKKVTIQDISLESGVSPSTVSRVLTGKAPVSQEKREAVQLAIKQLNYRPNHLARSLKTNTTFSVGLLLNDIANPFYSAIVRGVEEEANRQGYSVILCNTNEDPERELHYLQILQDKQVDGIIVGPTDHNAAYICELAQQIPLIFVDRQVDDKKVSAVVVDNEASCYRATQLLIEHGYQRIALLRQNEIATMEERYHGYERALLTAGIPLDPSLVIRVECLSWERACELTEQLFASFDRPPAIFALNNQLGLGALSAIQRVGLTIPDDIALIIFDDMAAFSLLTPPITVIKQPAFAMGEQAMRLLLKQMQTTKGINPEVITLPTELVERASV
ncbi:LacI family DNA-binding transcriptional regulator [Chloroflexota bacterium]